MTNGDLKKPLEKLCRLRPPLNGEKVQDLNEETRMAATGFAHSLHKLAKSGKESIMTNAEQRTAGDVAHTGCFNHQSARLSFGKSPVPIKICLGDETVFGGPPGHHCRHPGAAFQADRANGDWLEKERPRSFLRAGPARFRDGMLDWVGELPHRILSIYHDVPSWSAPAERSGDGALDLCKRMARRPGAKRTSYFFRLPA